MSSDLDLLVNLLPDEEEPEGGTGPYTDEVKEAARRRTERWLSERQRHLYCERVITSYLAGPPTTEITTETRKPPVVVRFPTPKEPWYTKPLPKPDAGILTDGMP
ncbi:MAG: hypothetical protein PHQ43_11335 [Dehalococcoidales bacterium]|nr:hypothetical protein [Dehalococcoidales bacterium]